MSTKRSGYDTIRGVGIGGSTGRKGYIGMVGDRPLQQAMGFTRMIPRRSTQRKFCLITTLHMEGATHMHVKLYIHCLATDITSSASILGHQTGLHTT